MVGGGITGLSAAFYLQRQARERGIRLELTLIEAAHRLGGKIQTVRRDGFIVERGPDSFLARKAGMRDLVKGLGLENELVRSAAGQTYVLSGEELHPVPGGSILGVPRDFSPFLSSGLLSWSGKVRAAAELMLPKPAPEADESVGAFFRRRFGGELVDNLIEPLLAGIYAGDIDRLSLESTFPQFRRLEQEHRSLLYGIRKSSMMTGPQPLNPGEGIYQTFRGGLDTVVRALEEALVSQGAAILKGVRAERCETERETMNLTLNDGSVLQSDGIILAVPHFMAKKLFKPHGFLEELDDMPFATVATVSVAFREEDVDQHLEGTGFVVSRNTDTAVTACTWTHRKWPHSAPEGHTLFRAYVGRRGNEMIVDISDSEISKAVLEDLRKTMDIRGEPEFVIVSRFPNAMPQYPVGHKDRVAEAKAELQRKFPGVELAGSSYGGIGLPDCAEQGKTAAAALLERL